MEVFRLQRPKEALDHGLIALVYPIVLTFVAILPQRRAFSKFALGFHMRDSAVLPAGTSSLRGRGSMIERPLSCACGGQGRLFFKAPGWVSLQLDDVVR